MPCHAFSLSLSLSLSLNGRNHSYLVTFSSNTAICENPHYFDFFSLAHILVPFPSIKVIIPCYSAKLQYSLTNVLFHNWTFIPRFTIPLTSLNQIRFTNSIRQNLLRACIVSTILICIPSQLNILYQSQHPFRHCVFFSLFKSIPTCLSNQYISNIPHILKAIYPGPFHSALLSHHHIHSGAMLDC